MKEANHDPSPCMQRQANLLDPAAPRPLIGREDCLYLNIWQPSSTKAPKPVMVFIHGGAFLSGGLQDKVGKDVLYDGAKLALQGDVVVVAIQYRLGALGYFAAPTASLANKVAPQPNLGLLDQLEALRWVNGAIAHFGGDPSNVTIFGESAGAMSVCALLGLKEAKGLFTKAIMQSGACEAAPLAEAQRVGAKVVESLGCAGKADDQAMAACLLKAEAGSVVDAQPKFSSAPGGALEAALPLQIIVDGTLVRRSPWEALDGAGDHGIEAVIVGNNSEEIPTSYTYSSSQYAKAFAATFAEEHLEAAKSLYSPFKYGGYGKAVAAAATDLSFACKNRRIIQRLTETGATRVYQYVFTVPGRILKMPSFHGSELLYLFQHAGSFLWMGVGQDKIKFQEAFADYWANFARRGAPGGTGAAEWRSYGRDEFALDLTWPLGSLHDYRAQTCDALDEWRPAYP